MSVGESSDDNLLSTYSEQYTPAQTWIDAFNAQCNQTLLKRLRRYALLLARLPSSDQIEDKDSYAEELVQAVLADVVAGVLRWDPAVTDLEPYLADVIRLRVRRDRRRAGRYSHLSIDALRAGDPTSPMHEVEAQLAARAAPEDNESGIAGAMTDTMRKLRDVVGSDPVALRFLDAIDRGATTRADIMSVAGLSRAEYHNMRRRIARLLTQMNVRRCLPEKDN